MGAKKKSLANRLAKMSDEERARYLQRKADIEEEARRRKEQLISTFMKNKIKKEDGFSRLNLAKINQNWHQILRFNKCKEMKEDVENMKKSIESVINYKNRTIEKLLEELEMAEEQYSHNFQAHMSHIDKTLEDQNYYLDAMNVKFREELSVALDNYKKEEKEILQVAGNEQKHLKTMIFGLESNAKKRFAEDRERYLQKKEEVTSTFRLHFDSFVRHRRRINAAIWRQIAATVRCHVQQTDLRRMHLAELKRLDAESAAEISANQERIRAQQAEIDTLNERYAKYCSSSEEVVKNLKKQVDELSGEFWRVKKRFRGELKTDQAKILSLSKYSNAAIDCLSRIYTKCELMLNLAKNCAKFETLKEHQSKFLNAPNLYSLETDKDESKTRQSSSAHKETVKKIIISEKSPESSLQSSPKHDNEEISKITAKFAYLDDLQNFWLAYSKTELTFKELKHEKSSLEEENKQLKAMLRNYLESAVLSRQKFTTPKISVNRSSRSAPLRRILI